MAVKIPDEPTQIVDLRNAGLKPLSEEVKGILTVLTGGNPGAVFPLDQPDLVIGRGTDASIRINDAGLSRRHAHIMRRAEGYFLEDFGSTNGTYYNGVQINETVKLDDGCRIQIGKNTVLRFSLQDKLEQEASKQMYEMTVRDPLTRLHNRRYLDERLHSEFSFAVRHGTPLAVLIIDVDHFKQVNDTAGHQAGDAVLRALSAGLQKMVRAEDALARFGGEEFVIAARGIDDRSALAFAERIRHSVESMVIPWSDGELRITISIGLAHMGKRRFSGPDALIAAADGSLYQAKRNGRNRVEVA